MRVSTTVFVILAILPNLCLSLPAAASAPKSSGVKAKATASTKSSGSAKPTSQTPATGNPAAGNTPSDKQISNAVISWMNDTGKVTKFLDTATSFSGDEFTRQATIALNAEKDELNHKMVLDAALGQMATVQAANDTLVTQGTFQAVVDILQSMVDNGPDTAQSQVDAINTNRCVNVLPNIGAYFAAAGTPEMTAIRPTGCLEVQNSVASSTAAPAQDASPATGGAGMPSSTTAIPEASAPSASVSKTAGAAAPKATGKSSSKSAMGKPAAAKTSGSMMGAKGAASASRRSSSAAVAETVASSGQTSASDGGVDASATSAASSDAGDVATSSKPVSASETAKPSARSSVTGTVKASSTKAPSTVKAAGAAKAKPT